MIIDDGNIYVTVVFKKEEKCNVLKTTLLIFNTVFILQHLPILEKMLMCYWGDFCLAIALQVRRKCKQIALILCC